MQLFYAAKVQENALLCLRSF